MGVTINWYFKTIIQVFITSKEMARELLKKTNF